MQLFHDPWNQNVAIDRVLSCDVRRFSLKPCGGLPKKLGATRLAHVAVGLNTRSAVCLDNGEGRQFTDPRRKVHRLPYNQAHPHDVAPALQRLPSRPF